MYPRLAGSWRFSCLGLLSSTWIAGMNHSARLYCFLHFWVKYIHRVEAALSILSNLLSVQAGQDRKGEVCVISKD